MSVFPPLIAVLVSFVLTNYLLFNQTTSKIKDLPNERSLHSKAVPRIGGVGLMAGILSGWLLLFGWWVWWLVLPLLSLFVISLFDDLRSLPVKQRILIHFLAAAMLLWGSGFVLKEGFVVSIALLFIIVWMTNLYNFMDGSDGLAGGMATFGFGLYGAAALLAHNTPLALFNFSVAMSAVGFLYFNLHPAKIFMGDSGSIPLGFLAAGMGLWGWQQGAWLAWYPLLIFSPFIVDASVTLLKRALRGAKVTEAHREHYYQRLVQMGWGHRNVALAEYGLMLGVGVSALSVQKEHLPWQMLLVWSVVYICLMWLLDSRWKNFAQGKND